MKEEQIGPEFDDVTEEELWKQRKAVAAIYAIFIILILDFFIKLYRI